MKILYVFVLLNLIVNSVFAEVVCPRGKHWVQPHVRRTFVRYDGARVESSKVSGHCRMNPKGYDMWHQSISNKRPKVWGYKKEKSKKWTTEEIQRLYEAVSVLPEKLLNLKYVKIYRMEESQYRDNPATTNVTEVTLYDKAFNHNDSLAQIISHEFSHILYDQLSNKDKMNFRKSAGWVERKEFKGYVVADKNKVFIQPDSRDSISEDFANHIEYYLFKNSFLKKNSPKAYRWIKNNFGKSFQVRRRSGL